MKPDTSETRGCARRLHSRFDSQRGTNLPCRLASHDKRHMILRVMFRRCTSLLFIAALGCGAASHPVEQVGNAQVSPGGADAIDWGELTSATTIEITDVRRDLSCVYEFYVRLTRNGTAFTGTAEIPHKGAAPGLLPMQLPIQVIAALQQEMRATLAEPARDAGDHVIMRMHTTADSPSGAITFSGPAGIYRLHYDDQFHKLKLAHNGAETVLDLTTQGDAPAIWQRYQAALRSIGLTSWNNAVCKT
jgi:hypothetical protein